MKTFNINEAAIFLGAHKETIRRMVAVGKIPGVKVGRSWRFIEEDLAMYMRNKYSTHDALQGVNVRSIDIWHSEEKQVFGGLTSPTAESVYAKALKLE